jgi:hypothetical protein
MLLLVLLACLALPLAAAAQGLAPASTLAAESEPNDTIATADPIVMGDTTASIAPIGDVDTFRLSLTAGQRVYVAAIPDCYPVELLTQLAVYDAAGNLVAEPNEEEYPGSYALRFVAPATANYFVRISALGLYEEQKTGPYTLLARNLPAGETAELLATTPALWNSEIDAALYPPFDIDRYSMDARAGDVFVLSLTMPPRGYLTISDANNTRPFEGYNVAAETGPTTVTFPVPYEAEWVIQVGSDNDFCDAAVREAQTYELSIVRGSLYVVGNKAGNVDGVAYGANDVLARDAAGAWRMVFDGEDVGLTTPLGGVEFMDNGSLLLSLSAAQALPGLGMVQATDIVRFVPTQLGSATQGAFSFYLRGYLAGLTLQGERIDAIALSRAGLLVSTYGSASVPRFGGGTLKTRDEDLLLFHASGPMPSAGTWELRVNGDGKYMLGSKFASNDLRGATTVDNLFGDGDNNVLFVADRVYRYLSWNVPAVAAPGDPVMMTYWPDWQANPQFWPPMQRTAALAFPTVISSLSIGPGWGN